MNRLLAYEEHVNGTQVEIIVEGERGKTFVPSVLTSIELEEVDVSNGLVERRRLIC